jgi:putative oxidoreductase
MADTQATAVRRRSATLPKPRFARHARVAIAEQARAVDDRVAELLRPIALPGLRILLGVLFIWFGALKVVHASPVTNLVSGTLPWWNPGNVVFLLGVVETVLGIGLLTGVMLRLVLPALAMHLTGTFLTFVMLPRLMFRHGDPLLLTADGEFVVKNIVLISAALVLIAFYRTPRPTLANAN